MTGRLRSALRRAFVAQPRLPDCQAGSFRSDSLVPVVVIALGIITLGLVVFAAGVVLQIIPYE